MTVRRHSDDYFDAAPSAVAKAIRTVLARRPPYVQTSEIEENTVFKTNVKPSWWLLGTDMTIQLQPSSGGTQILARTQSQWFIMGDVFKYYTGVRLCFFDIVFFCLASVARYGRATKTNNQSLTPSPDTFTMNFSRCARRTTLAAGTRRTVSWFRWPIGLMISAAFLAACSGPIEHNEELATKRALEFADIALLKQDFDRGYEQMSSKAKAYVPLNIFKDAMLRLHPDGFPTTIKATGYEPLAEYNKVYVTLRGDNAGRPFEYVLTLLGTAKTDYKVTIVKRSGFGSAMGLE